MILHEHPATSEGRERHLPPVVYVVSCFPPDIGGVERVAEEIAVRQSARRQVTVLTSRSRSSADGPSSYPTTMDVRRLGSLRLAQIPIMPRLFSELGRFPRGTIVHVHIAQAYVPETTALVARLRGHRYVAHFHLDMPPSTRLGPIFSLYKQLVLGRVLRSAMRVIVLNAEQAEQVVDLYGVDQGHVSIVPNAVADRFRVPPRAGGQSPNRPFRLLSVGRMSPQKNLPRLIEAMAQVQSDVVLTIVGEGPAAAEVEQLITRRGLGNIRMVGAQRGPQLAEWYRWADALVMTSDQEGMPMVLLEAMAAGLPIVATDVSGVGSTLGDAGLLVHPNATAVARGIDRLANDNDFAVELSRRGVARSEMFRWDRVLDLLDDVYETVGKWPL